MNDRCYAKVNLALDVFNEREDGYHDIKSVMVPVSFYDEISINLSNEDKYECNKKYIFFDDRNSIIKMINAFHKKYNINAHYNVYLNKQIPTKAGLAGGTADAAATLRILQKLHHIKCNDEEIRQLCVEVGADVYFNYYNKPAIVSGIGDELQFIDIKDDYYILLLKPKTGVSTKQAYETLDINKCDHPDIDGLANALKNGLDILPFMSNSLEQPALILNDEIKELKDNLRQKAGNSLMSGSGSTVFAISKNYDLLHKLNKEYTNSKYFVRFTKIVKE